jgi:hypothetical protein
MLMTTQAKMYSRTLHAEHEEDAAADNERFMRRVQKAMDYATEELGHDAWSRDLDDHVPAYAFCVPTAVYDDEDLCDSLEHWLARVFAVHYIHLSVVEWRDSSADEEWPDNCRYEVDWCGSRSRSVNIGPHLYMEFGPMLTRGKGPLDPGPAPELPLWYTKSEQDGCYAVNIKTVVVNSKEELATMVRKNEIYHSVLADACDAAWRRLDTQLICVAANHNRDEYWNADVQWTVVCAQKNEE